MSNDTFFRLPPDGVGKRLSANSTEELNYVNGSVEFVFGDVVTGATSGAMGTVIGVTGTLAEGALWIDTHDSFVDGENLRVGGDTYAVADGASYRSYTQTVSISGGNNARNVQSVDREGQAYVRFAEGNPSFDTFGSTRVSIATSLGDYTFDGGANADDYSDATANGGLITHVPTESAVIISTTGVNASSAVRTSNKYHKYFPGTGILIEMSVSCGDLGKTDNVRRWGFFDDANGFFFQLNGTTLQVVLRSSVSGSPVDTAVSQAAWNGDKVDGTGLSQVDVDLTKMNIWWMDCQWLGAGRVRMGIITPGGVRIVTHEFRNANAIAVAYMQTATLPIRFENFNTGVAGSTSELRFQCAAVKTESLVSPFFSNYSGALREALVLGSSFVPVAAIRPATTVGGRPNRNHVMPLSVVGAFSGSGAVVVQVIENAVLTGATWAETVGSVQGDVTASSYAGGKVVWTAVCNASAQFNIDLTKVYDFTSDTLRLNADGTQTQNVVVVAKVVGAGTPSITAAINWQELR